MDHFRNIETGEIKSLEPGSTEIADLKRQRTADGRFPLWEQTGAHDADPENHASVEEVASRQRWAGGGVALSDVTADGYGQSSDAARALGQDSALYGSVEHADVREERTRRPGRSKTAAAEK